MATELKAYKRYSAARIAAKGNPILRVGNLYIVGITVADGFLTEISLIAGDGRHSATVTARHLDRLGNANHAIAIMNYGPKIWAENEAR